MRDRTFTRILVEAAEPNANEMKPSAIQRRAAPRAERADVRWRRFIFGNQPGPRNDAKITGSHRCVACECRTCCATTHRAMAIHYGAEATVDFVADISA